jgi:hypothetical protein
VRRPRGGGIPGALRLGARDPGDRGKGVRPVYLLFRGLCGKPLARRGRRWAAHASRTGLPQRDVVDPEAGREAEVGRGTELDPDRLTAPACEAERLLRVVAWSRRIRVRVRGERSEQRARRAPHLGVEVVVWSRARLARRDVEPERVVGRVARRDAHRLVLAAARVVIGTENRVAGARMRVGAGRPVGVPGERPGRS